MLSKNGTAFNLLFQLLILFRRIFKAIILGADAVLLGRPYVYGLAIQKQKGAEAIIQNLQNDFELTARLSGCKNLQESMNRIFLPNKRNGPS